MIEPPAPPVPSDCDLRGFPFMPLEINRLRKSKAWLICRRRPELAFYMLNLWTSAWHEVPSGSLENDEDTLADRAMCDPSKWAEIRDDIMRHWAIHSDGRLYHPVVTEKVLEAWERRSKASQKGKAGASKRWAENGTSKAPAIAQARKTDGAGTARAMPGDSNRQGQGHRQGNLLSESKDSGASRAVDPAKRVFDLGKETLAPYGIKPSTAGGLITEWRRAAGDDGLVVILLDAGKAERADIVAYINGAVRAKGKRAGGFVPLGVGG